MPPEPLPRLFWRYLRFGLLAWGGPVAQINMIRQELVEERRWVTPEHFHRVLAVYQVLPGPEAHEMCVYFGMLSRGRLGGLLAGLGFMLPGFVLMLALSTLYTSGVELEVFRKFFVGVQPAVVALVVRAVYRIGQHALRDAWLWGLAAASGLGQVAGTSFWLTLPLSGLAYFFVHRGRGGLAAAVAAGMAAAVVLSWVPARVAGDPRPPYLGQIVTPSGTEEAERASGAPAAQRPSLLRLLTSGLRAGLLSFGGAYTVLPFLRHDAVEVGRWLTDTQFLDGVALSGVLPAPFVIFSTFVGFLGGGLPGALVLTAGVFAPAFAFTLIGHRWVERLVGQPRLHGFLDGVTAGVVGLIATTAVALFRVGVDSLTAAATFGLSLAVLYAWRAKAAVAAVVLGAGLLGMVGRP